MYSHLLMMFLAAGTIGALALFVGAILGPKKGHEVKLEPPNQVGSSLQK